jgi:hypothetical protein
LDAVEGSTANETAIERKLLTIRKKPEIVSGSKGEGRIDDQKKVVDNP